MTDDKLDYLVKTSGKSVYRLAIQLWEESAYPDGSTLLSVCCIEKPHTYYNISQGHFARPSFIALQVFIHFAKVLIVKNQINAFEENLTSVRTFVSLSTDPQPKMSAMSLVLTNRCCHLVN